MFRNPAVIDGIMGIDVRNLRELHNLGLETREWVAASQRSAGFGPLHARYVGHTEARDGYAFVRHAPDFSMILVSERGHGMAVVDGEWRRFPPGHAYITAPQTPHAYQIAPGGTWRVHWAIYQTAANLPTLEPGGAPRLVPVEATAFRHAVEGLCQESGGAADKGVMGLWGALVDRMVMRLLDSEDSDPRLDRLWGAVREDIGGDWSLRRMASTIGMSEENLRRLCQRRLGRSPVAHLTRLRMQMAEAILLHTQEKLASVAARLGYSDAFAFSTAFKRTTGKSPREFREEALESR